MKSSKTKSSINQRSKAKVDKQLDELASLKNRLFSIDALANELDCSKASIHNWVKEGILIPHKIGSRTYFLGADLVKLLTQSI